MFDRNRSGQHLPFCLVSAISGNAVTGASGAISGRRVIDGGVQTLLSGNIIETSGGTYRANLYDFDTDGNIIGYFFTASGCVPVHFTVITQQNVSGRIYPASGVNTTVPIASLSGVQPISGTFASVPIASISGVVAALISGTTYIASGSVSASVSSGVFLASGQAVYVYSGQLSGHAVDLLSGRSYTASGIFATATATVGSGTVYLASGHNLFYSGQLYPNSGLSVLVLSGQLSGHAVDLLSGRSYTASGIFVTATATVASGGTYLASGHFLFGSGQFYLASGHQAALYSGQSVLVNSGQLSGHAVDLLSGRSYTASGIFATATATVTSGGVYLASGHFLFGSGQYYLNSGQSVLIYSGQLSGHAVDLLSGRSFVASGINTVAAVTIASGTTYLASGQAVSLNSGQIVLVYSGQLSGHAVDLLSGRSFVASGINVVGALSIASGALSGQQVTLTSGASFIGSGHNTVVPITSISGTNTVVPPASLSGVNAIVPIASISGVVGNSGQFVSVPIASVSGINTIVPPATLSGVVPNVLSGLVQIASGPFVTATATITSGDVYLASGSTVIAGTVLDKSGYTLHSSGMDTVLVEAGMNARQALAIAAAAAGGRLSGAGTAAVRIDGANVSGTHRIAAVVDASGNRTSVILTLPG